MKTACRTPSIRRQWRSLCVVPEIKTGASVKDEEVQRVCTILFHRQCSPDSKLYQKLSSLPFPHHSNEFFLRVCNFFSSSWRPVHRFFQYSQLQPPPYRVHGTVVYNKMLDVIGKAKNIQLFWKTLTEMARNDLVDDKTFLIAATAFASARELKKSVEFVHMMIMFGHEYDLRRLNKVVESLCRKGKFVNEANFLVQQLKENVRPDAITYGWLIKGFCDTGDVVEASKVWNILIDEELEPTPDLFEKMIETFFKRNEEREAMKLIQLMRTKKANNLGHSCYRLVIRWLCRRGKIEPATSFLAEMRSRGVEPDSDTLGCIQYGLLARGRLNEARALISKVDNPDINVYHGMIKGFIRARKLSEATDVFREMIRRGSEPVMHTYVMLLQGHMGKRGRKGHHKFVNFDAIFVGGLVNVGRCLEATKYAERRLKGGRGLHVPRFDYNRFLYYYSNEEGAFMFHKVAAQLRDVGLLDLADIFQRYGEKMATRDRRRDRPILPKHFVL